MTAVAFDTLKLSGRLQAGGFTPEHARTAASALAEAAGGSELATKQDVAELGRTMKREIAAFGRTIFHTAVDPAHELASLKQALSHFQQTMEQDLLLLEQQLTIRFGGMLMVAVGVLLAAARYLPPPHP